MLGALNDVVVEGRNPPATYMLGTLAWAVGTIAVGAAFFISREREFAIRL
jgi:hypothetical protein